MFDPGLLQSVRWDHKPMSRHHMTLPVDGTLNPNQSINLIYTVIQHFFSALYFRVFVMNFTSLHVKAELVS